MDVRWRRAFVDDVVPFIGDAPPLRESSDASRAASVAATAAVAGAAAVAAAVAEAFEAVEPATFGGGIGLYHQHGERAQIILVHCLLQSDQSAHPQLLNHFACLGQHRQQDASRLQALHTRTKDVIVR